MAKLNEKALADDDKLSGIKDQFKAAKEHTANWRAESRECFDFVAGRQWSDEDKAKLEEEGRPVITFNRMGPYFDAISGYEINNRQEIKFKPRTLDDTRQTETLNAAVKWVLDGTNAEDEESDAFMDTLICGIGWISTSMDYETDPDGKVVMERVDPCEMYWDPHARKKNLSDAKFLQRIQWKDEDEIKSLWPNATLVTTADVWEDEPKKEPHNASLAFLYKNNATGYDEKEGRYRVIQHQYYETQTQYRMLDPATGEQVWLTEAKFKVARKMFEEAGVTPMYAKQKRRIYRECFVVGDEIVEENDLGPGGFTFKAITGKRDRNENLWYGLARVMIDPQKWANKFFSQILHIINSNAKGGLLAEEGAFVDPKKAEENWSDPSAVIQLKNGAIAGGKIKERQPAQYPQGLDRMLQFAVTSIPDVTGVNTEFLGSVDRQQAGVLEQERKKSAFTILAGFFDSMRLYRKDQARLLMHFIKEYLNDGRIIRITTAQGEQAVPLKLTDDVMNYDVIVDQAPDSPNLKEEVWSTLGTLVPQFLKAGIPLPPDILKFSPLPTAMADKFAEAMSGRLPPQVQEQMTKMQQEVQSLQQENAQLKVANTNKMAAVQSKHELGKEQNAILAGQIQSQEAINARKLDQEQSKDIADLQLELKRIADDNAKFMAEQRKAWEQEMADRMKDLHIAELNAAVKRQSDMTKLVSAQKTPPPPKPDKVGPQIVKMLTTLQSEISAVKEEAARPKKINLTVKRDAQGKIAGGELTAA